jgi:enoyl-CoA hydratase
MADLLFTVDGPIATIILNRPEQRNAITFDMWCALPEICSRIESDPDVRTVIVQGAGDEAFCAGDDMPEFAHQSDDPWRAKIYIGKVEMALQAFLRLTKPTLALVKGSCISVGCMLAAHCDLRISADNGIFGLTAAELGMVAGYGEIQRLIHLIGAGPTLDLLLSARLIDAPEARSMGLCTQIFPLSIADEAAHELALRMARLAPLAQAWHKQMVGTVLHNPDLTDLSVDETMLPEACFDTEDFVEGIQAFLDRRPPRFHGR